MLLQVRLQAHRRGHHRHLCQGRVPCHVRRGERDLLGGIHHVKGFRAVTLKKLLELGHLGIFGAGRLKQLTKYCRCLRKKDIRECEEVEIDNC